MKKQPPKIEFFEEALFPFQAPPEADDELEFSFDAPDFSMPEIAMESPGIDMPKGRNVQATEQLRTEDGEDDIQLHSPRHIIRDHSRTASRNAEALVENIIANGNGITRCIVTGTFILGDFLYEIVKRLAPCKVMLATFSFSRENVLLLIDGVNTGKISKLDLIISDYFYNHYKETYWQMLVTGIPPSKDTVRYAVCGTHAKLFMVIPDDPSKPAWSVEGSANLRSCQNVEQLLVEVDNQDTHHGLSFHSKWMNRIFDRFELRDRRKLNNSEMWDCFSK